MTRLAIGPPHKDRGFSLLELSLVLLILGLVGGSLLNLGYGYYQLQQQQETERTLQSIQETLLGFAASQGRLPCPAAPNGNNLEDCSRQHGVLPSATLGLLSVDRWGNPFRYYASQRFTSPLPEQAVCSFTLDSIGNASVLNLSGQTIASELPALVISHGPNGRMAIADLHPNEAENADEDLIFISAPPSAHFDDQLVWINPNLLKSRLLQAGRLP